MNSASSTTLATQELAQGTSGTSAAAPTLLSDQCLAETARIALHRSPLIPNRRITVSVGRGAITLAGTVNWPFQKAAAARRICDLTYDGPLFDKIAVSPPLRWIDLKTKIKIWARR